VKVPLRWAWRFAALVALAPGAWAQAPTPAPDEGTPVPAAGTPTPAPAKPDAPMPPTPSGPPPVARITCAPQPVRIAEPLVCTLVVDHRPDVSIAVTAPAEVSRDKAGPPEPLPDGTLRSTRTLTVRPRGLKPVRVEGLAVTWQETSGYTGTLAIPPQRVQVKSLVAGVADADFRTYASPQSELAPFVDRHGPLPHLVRNWALIFGLYLAGALLIGVLIGVPLRRWLRARRRPPAPYVDPRPAHVIALERLERLLAEDLPARGETKQLYFRLSEIVRDYLARRFHFDAMEMTSQEVLVALTTKGDGGPNAQGFVAVRDFLEETDLVKFAGFSATDEGDTAVRMARGLIELTRGTDAPVVAEAAA
jgi:hypothetical protein